MQISITGSDNGPLPKKKRSFDVPAMIRLRQKDIDTDGQVSEFFWSKVDKTPGLGKWGDCWFWTGGISKQTGYGNCTKIIGKKTTPHRIAYVLVKGPIADGLELNHECEVKRCVNPDHLEPMTHEHNMLFSDTLPGLNAKKTHCPKGHPYNQSNTYRQKNGGRVCKRCRYEKIKAWTANKLANDPDYKEKYLSKKRAYSLEYQRKQRGLNPLQ